MTEEQSTQKGPSLSVYKDPRERESLPTCAPTIRVDTAPPTPRNGAREEHYAPAGATSITVEEKDPNARLDEFLFPTPRPGRVPILSQARRVPFFLLASMLIMATSLNITNSRMPDPKKWKQLPDVALDTLPRVTSLEHVTDLLLWILNISNVLVVLSLYLLHKREEQRLRALANGLPEPNEIFFDQETLHGKIWTKLNWFLFNYFFDDNARLGKPLAVDNSHNKDIFSPAHRVTEFTTLLNVHLMGWIRFWGAFCIMTLFRSFVIVFTVLPATNNHCQHPQEIEHPVQNIILAIVTFGGGSIHCGDLLFSGHTSTVTCTFISIWTYGILVNRWVRPVALLSAVGTWFTILLSRSHYSDDILVAFYCSVFTYIALRHDTCHGLPDWVQMFLIPFGALAKCCESCAEDEEEAEGDQQQSEKQQNKKNNEPKINGVSTSGGGGVIAGVPTSTTNGFSERHQQEQEMEESHGGSSSSRTNSFTKRVASALVSAGHHHGGSEPNSPVESATDKKENSPSNSPERNHDDHTA